MRPKPDGQEPDPGARHVLDYALRQPWYRRVRWRRWMALCMVALVAGAGWQYRQAIGLAARHWAWNRQCARYEGRVAEVIYERDPKRRAALLRDRRYSVPLADGPAMLIPAANEAWTKLAADCRDHGGYRANLKIHAPLFMHELRTPRGRRELVLVSYSGFGSTWPEEPPATMLPSPTTTGVSFGATMLPPPPGTQPEPYVSGYLLIVEVLTPSFMAAPSRSRGEEIMIETQRRMAMRPSGGILVDPQNPHDVIERIYAGQSDANDAAHFTIDFETPHGRGTFDGRLHEDGSVKISRR